MTYDDKGIKDRADPKIAAIMHQSAEIVFDSPNDTRIFSLDLAYQQLLESPKFLNDLLHRGLQGKTTDAFIRLEAYKLITKNVYEAETDWQFEELHP